MNKKCEHCSKVAEGTYTHWKNRNKIIYCCRHCYLTLISKMNHICEHCGNQADGSYGELLTNQTHYCCNQCYRKVFPQTTLRNKKGLCSGTFSIPHVGHVLFINECKKHCDNLTVMIANNAEIRDKKGEVKIDINHRIDFFTSLKSVDKLVISPYDVFGEGYGKLDGLYNYLMENSIDIYFVNEDAFDLEERIKFCNENSIEIKVLSRTNNNSNISSSELYNV